MVCTSGGDPDSPVGKGCQVKDTLHSVCIYPCVHVCLEGVMWSARPNAADYKQLAGSSLGQSDEPLVVTSGRRRSINAGFLYDALLILRCGFQIILGRIYSVLLNVFVYSGAFVKRVHFSSCPGLLSSPKCLCCLEHSKKSFVLMWRSCGFVKEEQKTPLEPECRVECMLLPPPCRPVTKMLND